jgi:hypothetical protein
MGDITERFARDRDHMRFAKFELFGCLETERSSLEAKSRQAVRRDGFLGLRLFT